MAMRTSSSTTGGGGVPTFSVSGHVRDSSGDPISGVTVSAGSSGSATTDASGYYTVTLSAGTYTLTPSKSGYSFSPDRRTVSVSQDVTRQDFLGVADGGPLTPFLDLPFDYGNSRSAFVKAIQDTDDGGRVDSWFDHEYPDYSKNQNIRMYTGDLLTRDPYNPHLGCYERRCYDGHNGLDFTGSHGLAIRPAAEGKVVTVTTGCAPRMSSCGGGYGNH